MDSYEDLQKQRMALKEELTAATAGSGARAHKSGKALDRSAGDLPDLDIVLDIPVRIAMEVGSARISIRELLQLNQGAVVELDRAAGEPLDVLVNGTLIARGEVVVVNDKLGIRLTDVISPADRLNSLR